MESVLLFVCLGQKGKKKKIFPPGAEQFPKHIWSVFLKWLSSNLCACVCVYVCVLAHAHLSVSVRVHVFVCGHVSLPNVFSLCVTGGWGGREGPREVLSRNRASNVSYYTPRPGEKKGKRRRRREPGEPSFLQGHLTGSLWRLQPWKMKISSVVFALLTRVLLGGRKSLFCFILKWMWWRQNVSHYIFEKGFAENI